MTTRDFVSVSGTGEADVFVRHSVVSKSGFEALDEGDSAGFQVEHGAKGPAEKTVVRR